MRTVENLDPTWDLSVLYNSFEDPCFIFEIKKCEECFSAIKKLLADNSNITAEYLLNCLEFMDTANLLFSKVSSFVNLTLMVDSSCTKALGFIDRISALQSDSHQVLTMLQHMAGNIEDIEEMISVCSGLEPYAFLLRESRRSCLHNAQDPIEDTILKMQMSGSRAWQNLRNSLDGAAAVTVVINGEKKILPLPLVRGLAADPDTNIRKSAYTAELDSYKNYEIPMAACLSAIKGEALITAKLRGFDNVLDQMLYINKMDHETLDAMMSSIKSHLPSFHTYLKAKSRMFGHRNSLPWYDLLAPAGQSSMQFTFEEACDYLCEVFTHFNKDMGNFIEHAFKNRWIDALPKSGKIGGALCADLPSLRQNRIFANFSGSYSSVRTLGHELGHAFHSRCLDEVPLVMRDAPTPICETASLFNETVIQEYFLHHSSSEDKLFILEAGLSEAAQTVVDIFSRFIFEQEVFKRRSSHGLAADELCEIMTEAQKEAYGDSLDQNYLHPYMWMCKVHYYIPEFHYYNFPYIFGLLFAKGLYGQYKAKPQSFMHEYTELLKSTCSDNLAGIASRAGIDIRSSSFWDNSLDMIVKDIDSFLLLCKDSDQKINK